MKLSNPEKLIILLLARLHQSLRIKSGLDLRLLIKAIDTDNTWALSAQVVDWKVEPDEMFPPNVLEIVDILEMWSAIEKAWTSFDKTTKSRIEVEAMQGGYEVKFMGFNGESERGALSIAEFLIDEIEVILDLKRYRGRTIYANTPQMEHYRGMLEIYQLIEAKAQAEKRTLKLWPEHVSQMLGARQHLQACG